jgi:hypothetical protein
LADFLWKKNTVPAEKKKLNKTDYKPDEQGHRVLNVDEIKN